MAYLGILASGSEEGASPDSAPVRGLRPAGSGELSCSSHGHGARHQPARGGTLIFSAVRRDPLQRFELSALLMFVPSLWGVFLPARARRIIITITVQRTVHVCTAGRCPRRHRHPIALRGGRGPYGLPDRPAFFPLVPPRLLHLGGLCRRERASHRLRRALREVHDTSGHSQSVLTTARGYLRRCQYCVHVYTGNRFPPFPPAWSGLTAFHLT